MKRSVKSREYGVGRNDATHGSDTSYGNDPRTFAESAGWNGFFEWNDLK